MNAWNTWATVWLIFVAVLFFGVAYLLWRARRRRVADQWSPKERQQLAEQGKAPYVLNEVHNPAKCADPACTRSGCLMRRSQERRAEAVLQMAGGVRSEGPSSHHRHASERAADHATDPRTAELMHECEIADSVALKLSETRGEPIFILYPPGRTPIRIWKDGYVQGEPAQTLIINRVQATIDAERARAYQRGRDDERAVQRAVRPRVRVTHTYVELDLSPAAYDEIATRLREAGYGHAFMDSGAIDMQGIAVTLGECVGLDVAIKDRWDAEAPTRDPRSVAGKPTTFRDFPWAGSSICERPPEGWVCSREPGHDGPCAARPAYQQRVIDERAALMEKRERLDDFISSDKFKALHDDERKRLYRQALLMRLYSEVLFERIMAFETVGKPVTFKDIPWAGEAPQRPEYPSIVFTQGANVEALGWLGYHGAKLVQGVPFPQRMLMIAVSHDDMGDVVFSPKVAEAMRAYADALDSGQAGSSQVEALTAGIDGRTVVHVCASMSRPQPASPDAGDALAYTLTRAPFFRSLKGDEPLPAGMGVMGVDIAKPGSDARGD